VLSVDNNTPSTKKATEATEPPASAAVAAIFTTEPITKLALFAGEVILTVGNTLGAPNVPAKVGNAISAATALSATKR
jgi:hypothetical protein